MNRSTVPFLPASDLSDCSFPLASGSVKSSMVAPIAGALGISPSARAFTAMETPAIAKIRADKIASFFMFSLSPLRLPRWGSGKDYQALRGRCKLTRCLHFRRSCPILLVMTDAVSTNTIATEIEVSQALPTPLRLDADERFLGRNITIAFLDSGFYAHPDLTEPVNRIVAYHSIFAPEDDPTFLMTPDVASWHGMMTSVVAAGN